MKPELVEQSELMQVKLTLYFKNDPVNDPINDPISDPIKLTERQSMILQNFREDKTLTKESLCVKTGLSDATAKREIAYLKRIGVLKRIGSKKNGYWVVSK